jgi:hypothetical protein
MIEAAMIYNYFTYVLKRESKLAHCLAENTQVPSVEYGSLEIVSKLGGSRSQVEDKFVRRAMCHVRSRSSVASDAKMTGMRETRVLATPPNCPLSFQISRSSPLRSLLFSSRGHDPSQPSWSVIHRRIPLTLLVCSSCSRYISRSSRSPKLTPML